ncbi:hypothetical protein ACED66_23805 [Vibrio splendidus]|uniref:hypothetical protein n=1 Tax=Vibrio splendidus TaxID=29497 RepID=UPI000D3467EA|nr:hypothetical protein [Vibrio splendidus]MDH5976871.1 hypothetical protein [Vibrio splendidus]PTP93739.1 hypothetical protein CWO28_24080 [Vibrio splendidus]
MLNKKFLEDIRKSLNTNYFTSGDFEIEQSGSSLLNICFKYADYEFELIEVEETDEFTEATRFAISGNITRTSSQVVQYAIYSPGEYKATDKVKVSFYSLPEKIKDWSRYIVNDLVVVEDDDVLYEKIRDDLEQVFTINDVDNAEQVASDHEQSEVSEKLDRLYERLEELNIEVKFASEEMLKIRKEIDILKSSSANLPKGIWAKVAKNRLVEIAIKFFKTPEGRELIVHTIKQALPSS